MSNARINVTPALIVGVGGTGCTVAKLLKRIVYGQVDPKDRDKVAFGFMGIDADQDQVRPDKGEEPLDYVMPIHGRAQKFEIGDKSPQAQSFLSWLPQTRSGDLALDPGELAAGRGAGGKRAMGRYAFKYFAPLYFLQAKRLMEKLVLLDQNPIVEWEGIQFDRSGGLDIYIVCSFAGGTGSGGFLDTIAMCHKMCEQIANSRNVTMRGIFVMPSAYEYDAAAENRLIQKATAYACLKDLDHVMNQRSGTLTFDFHNGEDVTINRPFLDEIYVVDRQGSQGVVSGSEELMRMIATTLFGMVGTPMGRIHDSRQINAGSANTKSGDGGIKRYSTFGLVGVDYDIQKYYGKNAAQIGAAALSKLLFGPAGRQLSDGEVQAEAEEAIKSFKDGHNSFFIKELVNPCLAEVEMKDAEEVFRQEKPRAFASKIRAHKEAVRMDQLKNTINNDAKSKWPLTSPISSTCDRAKTTDALNSLLSRHGIANAAKVFQRAQEMLRLSRADIDDPKNAATESLETVVDSAVDPLLRTSFFEALAKRDEVELKLRKAEQRFNEGIRAILTTLACAAAKENVFSPSGLPKDVEDFVQKANEAVGHLGAAMQMLMAEADDNAAPSLSRSSLDLSGVLFDAPVPPGALPEPDDSKVNDLVKRISEKTSTLDFVAQCTRASVQGEGTSAQVIAAKVRDLSLEMVKSIAYPHILDVISKQPKDTDDRMARIVNQAFGNISPLMPVDTSRIEGGIYNFMLALVPMADGKPHAAAPRFEEIFRNVCSERRYDQPSVDAWPGPVNRLFINHWYVGMALNDKDMPILPGLRQAYRRIIHNNDYLEVDKNWALAPAPGTESIAGRDVIWTLGLAYGLIAVQNTRCYVNLVSSRVRDYKGNNEYDEYEVDLDLIQEKTGDLSGVAKWFDQICIAKSDQMSHGKRVPLAYELGGIPALTKTAHRAGRDLLGVGRNAAMQAFMENRYEDYQDVEDGIALVLDQYIAARGIGSFADELKKYRDSVGETSSTSDLDDQLKLEGKILDTILGSIRENRNFKLGGGK